MARSKGRGSAGKRKPTKKDAGKRRIGRANVSRKRAPPLTRKIIEFDDAIKKIGGEGRLRKGRHPVARTRVLSPGKKGIRELRDIVDGLRGSSPRAKYSYTLKIRFVGKDGKVKNASPSANIALPQLRFIRAKKGLSKEDRWVRIVYARIRGKVFEPIHEEFNFISENQIPAKVRNRAALIRKVREWRKRRNTKFQVTINREVF